MNTTNNPVIGRVGVHSRFGADAQSVGDAVDVIEEADDLDTRRYLFIVVNSVQFWR